MSPNGYLFHKRYNPLLISILIVILVWDMKHIKNRFLVESIHMSMNEPLYYSFTTEWIIILFIHQWMNDVIIHSLVNELLYYSFIHFVKNKTFTRL